MNSNRFFVAFVSGLLGVEEKRLADAYRLVAQHYEIETGSILRGVSAAVGDGGRDRLPLREWIDRQRERGVKSVSVRIAVQDGSDDDQDDDQEDDWDDDQDDDWDGTGDEDPEPHMLAGFAGGLPILMRVDTRSSHGVYIQGTVSGPRLLLTPSRFLDLINAQGDPDFFWPTVLEEINQFHCCNGRDEIAADALQAHFLSPEGMHDWEFMGQQIFRELQVESFTYDKAFVIPTGFLNHVDEVRPVCADFEPMVWLEIIDEDEVSAAALLRLVEAQHFGNRIWQFAADRDQLTEILDEHEALDDFPDIAATYWPRFLAGLADEDVSLVSQVLVELVRLECQSRGVQPCIPDDLADIFGPDDEERRRLHFRGRLQCDLGWRIREADDPGRQFVLDRVDRPVDMDEPMDMVHARQQFIEALTLVQEFARRVGSPFYPVFGAARYLASEAAGDGVLGVTVPEASDPGLEPGLSSAVQRITESFEPFGWGVDRLLGLAAISAADVFGGMGSWNDQAFEGADQEDFHAASSTLFSAMNRYFEALVSLG
ncbi:hypothetical protein [Telluria beijingensis]|uniref:hypothetical protein n=1 Tax=Telluria beijingensis TaxID=3068633 RepID=UPI0027959DAE|nr:hypothetical protein [Massilia sp. REN29]